MLAHLKIQGFRRVVINRYFFFTIPLTFQLGSILVHLFVCLERLCHIFRSQVLAQLRHTQSFLWCETKRDGDSLCVIMLLKPYIFSVCHVNRITCNSLLSTFSISADSPLRCTTDSFSLCWFEVNSHCGSSWLGLTLSSWPQVSQLKALVTETFL